MKKILTIGLLAALMLMCISPAFATSAYVRLNAEPTSTEVFKVGDEIEFVITADASQLTAMQFELKFPEGLSYVPGSGATPEGLAGKLGVPAADWTEVSKMFTFYNDLGIEMKETELVRFRCVAEKPGMWSVVLFQVLPFDENYEEFSPAVFVHSVTVTEDGSAPVIQLPSRDEMSADTPTFPVIETLPPETRPGDIVPEESKPAESEPTETTQPSKESTVPDDGNSSSGSTGNDTPSTDVPPEVTAPDNSGSGNQLTTGETVPAVSDPDQAVDTTAPGTTEPAETQPQTPAPGGDEPVSNEIATDSAAEPSDPETTEPAENQELGAPEVSGTDEEEKPEKKGLAWIWIVAGVITAAAGGAAAFLLLRKKKASK